MIVAGCLPERGFEFLLNETPSANYWTDRGEELAAAYAERPHTVRYRLVTRAIEQHVADHSATVIDVGGGCGGQAIALARLGHAAVVLDPDARMLGLARARLDREPATVRGRVELIESSGEKAFTLLEPRRFDVVCCHSVIMYLRDPVNLLSNLARLTALRGIVSILSVNPNSTAMRSGLQKNWRDTKIELSGGVNYLRYVPSVKHSLSDVSRLMQQHGFRLGRWYGVGVFSDHLPSLDEAELEDACEVEWVAGMREPYRSVARCFHALFTRNAKDRRVTERTE
jgi:S-adenosylmethionine-dependent methyltransferase